MIAYLNGSVISVKGNKIIVSANGVGYGASVSRGDALALRAGQEVSLFIHEHIQEKAYDLYGFMEQKAQDLFELLISINGVGPKAALAILDLGQPAVIRQAIAGGNSAYVAGASGVGRKTAERVVAELKEKLSGEGMFDPVHSTGTSDEALEALLALGYSQQQSMEALATVIGSTTEERLTQALKGMNT